MRVRYYSRINSLYFLTVVPVTATLMAVAQRGAIEKTRRTKKRIESIVGVVLVLSDAMVGADS